MLYAVIETGGKQVRVEEGETVRVEKLDVEVGSTYTFDHVLVVKSDELLVGTPYVEGASVTATVRDQGKAKKVIVYKYKRKTGYHRKNGHRQPYTELTIDQITAPGVNEEKALASDEEEQQTEFKEA